MNGDPSTQEPGKPQQAPAALRGPAAMVLALLAAASLGGGAVYLALRPAATEPPSDEEIAEMLGAAAERAMAAELPLASLGDETWTLETSLGGEALGTWLADALELLGGVSLPSAEPVAAEGAPATPLETPQTSEPRVFLLQAPEEARLRLLLALDGLGELTAPMYEDTVPTLAESSLPGLPPALEPPAPQGAPQLSVELRVTTAKVEPAP